MAETKRKTPTWHDVNGLTWKEVARGIDFGRPEMVYAFTIGLVLGIISDQLALGLFLGFSAGALWCAWKSKLEATQEHVETDPRPRKR
jgi:hypothetical protein